MATIVEMINPLTGLPEQVDKLDHTAQEIDDAVGIAPQLSNPNLLDNWYFGNPVNQRGQTSYTGAGYGIDRWTTVNPKSVVLLSDGCLTFYGNDNYTNFEQRIGSIKSFAGKTMTLSVLRQETNEDTIVGFLYDEGFSQCAVSTSKLISHTFTVPEGKTGNLSVFVQHYGADSIADPHNLVAAKLELGSQQTLAHQDENGNWVLNEIPDYGEQLARCQRYFWRSWTGERNTQNSILGVVFGNNHRITGFDYPVEMRTRPSITVYGLTGAGKVTEFASDADYGPASPAYWCTQRCVALACDGAGLSNDNRVYYFIEANAEL